MALKPDDLPELPPLYLGPQIRARVHQNRDLFTLFVAAICVGLLAGAVAGSFRLCLNYGAQWRNWLISFLHSQGLIGLPVLVVVCAFLAGLAGFLVSRLEPAAEGSGIPHTEAVVQGRAEPNRRRVLPIKFLGGVLAISSGMMLGREGPMVQMGGTVGIFIARGIGSTRAQLRVLMAAGAAAGLATAFNAPIAGGVFVLEELLQTFNPRYAIATLLASASGFLSARMLVDTNQEFVTGPISGSNLTDIPWYLVAGLVCGLAGTAYTHYILATLNIADRIGISRAKRCMIVGAGVGLLAWFYPTVVGGGDNLTQSALLGAGTLGGITLMLAIRIVAAPICYAAGTPGGIFAPMLVVGTGIGLLLTRLGETLFGFGPVGGSLAVVCMAAFFAAVVQAPVTGLVLTAEMTGATAMLPASLAACAIAMSIPMLLASPPVYEALAKRKSRLAKRRKVRLFAKK